MINLSPDTIQNGTWGSGYRYDAPYILWFSHVHAWQLAGIPVLPTTGPCKAHLGSNEYRSRFSHADEVVRPGYHAVTLDDYAVRAELTATTRVGFHRYRFDVGGETNILFDLSAEVGPSQMSDFRVKKQGSNRLVGYVENGPTRRRPKPTRIYFVVQLDRPFESLCAWEDGKLTGEVVEQRRNGGIYLTFKTEPGDVIQMKVAISYCSVEQAMLNLRTELNHWDFEQVVSEADRVWNSWLGRIKVEGGTSAQKTKFYTDLFHALLGRRRVSDVNGKYSDMTGPEQVIRQIPLDQNGSPRYEHHNTDAMWGAQWNLNLLWSIAYPEIIHNFCNTFVDIYKNGGLIPRGPSGGNYTFVMTSPSSTHLFTAAYQKGIRHFDIEAAYAGLVKNHGPGGLMSKAGYEHKSSIGGGVEYYLERGYVPLGIQAEAFHLKGATQTLEYAFCDWALAQLAQALGKTEDAKRFAARAENYRHLYDTQSGFMRPRMKDGEWLDPFDPMSPVGWVEGNGWQYLWHVPHDVPGLIALMGGESIFIERLDAMLTQGAEMDFIAPHDKHHLNTVDYGNQPSLYIAHLFTYAGAPWLTQKWVRAIIKACKSDITPNGGYGGDEDQGQMGSLNVLMGIGLFSVSGGSDLDPFYQITTPIFEKITIHLDPNYASGQTFVIEALNQAPENIYIESATFNGHPLTQLRLTHVQLATGGILQLTLSDRPGPISRGESKP